MSQSILARRRTPAYAGRFLRLSRRCTRLLRHASAAQYAAFYISGRCVFLSLTVTYPYNISHFRLIV